MHIAAGPAINGSHDTSQLELHSLYGLDYKQESWAIA